MGSQTAAPVALTAAPLTPPAFLALTTAHAAPAAAPAASPAMLGAVAPAHASGPQTFLLAEDEEIISDEDEEDSALQRQLAALSNSVPAASSAPGTPVGLPPGGIEQVIAANAVAASPRKSAALAELPAFGKPSRRARSAEAPYAITPEQQLADAMAFAAAAMAGRTELDELELVTPGGAGAAPEATTESPHASAA